ncbi:MAG: phage head closure protein [Desulfobacterales bacterium]
MRSKITIEKATETRGSSGGVEKTWSTYVTRRASIEPLVGKEYFKAQQEQTDITVKMLIRYDSLTSLINPRDYRVKHGGVIYDIETPINPMERNRDIELMCRIRNGG